MNLFRKHIFCKISVIILVIALLAPSFVKFSSVFDNHVHQFCKNPQKTHFHKFDKDCAFYDFNLNIQFSVVSNDFECLDIKEDFKTINSEYYFLKDSNFLHFSLRGPPQIV